MIKKIYTTVHIKSERKGLFMFSNSNRMDQFSDLKKPPHSRDPIAKKRKVCGPPDQTISQVGANQLKYQLRPTDAYDQPPVQPNQANSRL